MRKIRMVTKIYTDKQGRAVFAYSWATDLVVTEIASKEKPKAPKKGA